MNIAVFGTGFVAGAYLRAIHYLGYHPLVLSRAWLNPDDANALALCLDGYKPQYIISASGFHVDTVDECQWDKRGCYHDHVLLPRALSDYCASRDVTFIHVSSGCIFNGVGPFKETDEPNFETGFYQHCKVEAEVDIVTSGARSFIFRIRMPYSHFVHPRNWLVKLCEYDRILDGLNSVTMLDTFALRSLQLATGGKAEPGIYHCCLLYTSDAADERSSVDLGGRRIIKKKRYRWSKS